MYKAVERAHNYHVRGNILLRHQGLCLGATISACLFLTVSSARAQCTKDTDCKGERICATGACVDPPRVQQQAIAEPTSDKGVATDSVAPANPAAPNIPAPPSSNTMPTLYVCQPPTVHPAGAGVAGAGSAAEPLSASPDQRREVSFRLSAGLGYWYADFQHEPRMGSGASEASGFSGTGITTSIAIEGASSRNVSVFVELLGSFLRDPSVKSPFGFSSAWDGTYGLISIGPGVAHYFDRLDVYTSATLTLTRLYGKMTDGQLGYGANFAFGKEWWPSTSWRAGLVGGLQVALDDDSYRGITTSIVPSLRFSSTWD